MSKACNQILGSNIEFAFVPTVICGQRPVLHNLILGAAIAIGSNTITIGLDPASTDPVYTAASVEPLTTGTILTFGANRYEVIDANDGTNVYNLTTTPAVVNIVRSETITATAAVTQSVLGLRLCVSSANIQTNKNSVDNTLNCTKLLFTNIITGVTKTLDLMGFLASKDFAYYVLAGKSRKLGSASFAINYANKFYIEGTVQLVDPNLTEVQVKSVTKWTVNGEIQTIDFNGESFVKDAAALADLTARRARWGFGAPEDVTINPLAVY
jgi:hypothetical protein